jgi:hypothetical protein
MWMSKNTVFECENHAYMGCVPEQSAERNIGGWKYQGAAGNDITGSYLLVLVVRYGCD